jgi:hypothetical protein
MRSNQNPSGSATRSVGARGVGEPNVVAKLSMPQMPVEWLDSGSWRLPSGKALAEFALQAGFLAPLLFRAEGLGKSAPNRNSKAAETPALPGSSEMTGSVAPSRGKQLGKGDGR